MKKNLAQIRDTDSLLSYLFEASPETLQFLAKNPVIIKVIIKTLEGGLKRKIFSNPDYPKKVLEDKYNLYHAFLKTFESFLLAEKGQTYLRALIYDFLPRFLASAKKQSEKNIQFEKEFGVKPPSFIAVSPGKFCNLKCKGCYACSDSSAKEKLSFSVFDWILKEKANWGSWFTVLSGGEPLLWKDGPKDIFDIAKKHPDQYFLMYTNSTAIDKKVARKLAEVANITPAISVEGFEVETDWRRGKGVFKKILRAMDYLKAEGVPFGISVTATRKNINLIKTEEFYRFFRARGAFYAWMFHLMPIGRGSFDLVITADERLELYNEIQKLIKKGYFIADFWNCGAISDGCISAGREGGYFYIEWNGHITPCAFNPYSFANVNELYQKKRKLGEVINMPYMKDIRRWQKNYGFRKPKEKIGNWIMPCPIRDHYNDLHKIMMRNQLKPIDGPASKAIKDSEYQQKMAEYDKSLSLVLDPIWQKIRDNK